MVATLDEVIARLEEIREQYGGDLAVFYDADYQELPVMDVKDIRVHQPAPCYYDFGKDYPLRVTIE